MVLRVPNGQRRKWDSKATGMCSVHRKKVTAQPERKMCHAFLNYSSSKERIIVLNLKKFCKIFVYLKF